MPTTTQVPSADLGEHAVVLGGSLAGLSAATTLAGRFRRVTIIERDQLPLTGEGRRGVPQGIHAHLLLPSGLTVLREMFPGFDEDLTNRGGHVIPAAEFRFYLGAGRLAFDTTDLAISGATRPLIEGIVRERVRALPNVTFLEQTEATGLLVGPEGHSVAGVRLASRSGGEAATIAADLVVDTTGRGSRSPRWLAEVGYDEPAEERLQVGVHYSTRLFRRDPADLDGCRHVLIAIPTEGRRGGLALAIEGGRWLVTLVGSLGERPPADLDEFTDYAASLWKSDLHHLIAGSEPAGTGMLGGFPAYQRRRYDGLRRFPDRYVVSGDAICSLSPIYGQGMSVALQESQQLGQVLDRHGLDQIGPRFFDQTRGLVETAWTLATGSDLTDPDVEGPRPASWRLVNSYLERLLPIATRDPLVANTFLQVNSLLAPPQRLMSPRIARRVLLRRRPDDARPVVVGRLR